MPTTRAAETRPTGAPIPLLAALAALSAATVLLVGGEPAPAPGPMDHLDPIGLLAVQEFRRGYGIEPLTVVVDGRSYVLSRGDGAGAVSFGGMGPGCPDDMTTFVFTESGEASPLWPDARRVGAHWFRTEECLPGGLE
ncbi:MAG: hypothetical protein U0Q22_07755 [Acidimicrobiales bacterium]